MTDIRSIPSVLNDELAFTFSNSGIVNIVQVAEERRIKRIEVIIDEAFDDTNATLKIGISGENDKFVKTYENKLYAIGEYEVEQNFVVTPVALMIQATINPGTSTTGSGTIIIHYY